MHTCRDTHTSSFPRTWAWQPSYFWDCHGSEYKRFYTACAKTMLACLSSHACHHSLECAYVCPLRCSALTEDFPAWLDGLINTTSHQPTGFKKPLLQVESRTHFLLCACITLLPSSMEVKGMRITHIQTQATPDILGRSRDTQVASPTSLFPRQFMWPWGWTYPNFY